MVPRGTQTLIRSEREAIRSRWTPAGEWLGRQGKPWVTALVPGVSLSRTRWRGGRLRRT